MDPRTASASLGGGLLAGATGALAAVRRAAKPLHPDGEVGSGSVERLGTTAERTGVPWLDEPGTDDVLVRRSRAIGLPRRLPDIHGLALRVPHVAGGYGDLLFATTGRGRLTRFVLTASRDPNHRPMTTLLPYRSPTGPVVLGVEGAGIDEYQLSWARPQGAWHAFAVLRLSPGRLDDHVSFDPLVNRVPGLEQYPAVWRLREPSYLRARRSRAATS